MIIRQNKIQDKNLVLMKALEIKFQGRTSHLGPPPGSAPEFNIGFKRFWLKLWQETAVPENYWRFLKIFGCGFFM